MQRTLALALFLAPAVTLVAAARPHFDSHPVDGTITIDGSFDDWTGSPGNLEPFGQDSIAIQALNDGTFLYLRLSASDPGVRTQIARRGLTVWFDPKGGTKKTFGVRYPVIEDQSADAGIGGYRFGGRRQPGASGQGSGTSSGTGDNGGTTVQPEDTEQPPDRVDILGPGKNDEVSLTREHLQGVEVAFKVEQGILQYELKVPLAKTDDMPYAIAAAPGGSIGIGLETAKAQDRMNLGQQGGGGYGGGGMGGGGFGGRGGFGRGGGGGMGRHGGGQGSGDQTKPLKGWGTITLASAAK